MENNKAAHLSKFSFWGVIVTLGIVYGDIGTSPLYVMKAIIGANSNIDVNWETGLMMKVNKLITASVSTQLVYDDNILKRTQFKEVLGIGLGYKF